jgi:hypothetical protein
MIKTKSDKRIVWRSDKRMVSRPRRKNFGASKNAKALEKLEPISKTLVTPESFSRRRAGMTIVVIRVFLRWLLVIALIEIYTDGERIE